MPRTSRTTPAPLPPVKHSSRSGHRMRSLAWRSQWSQWSFVCNAQNAHRAIQRMLRIDYHWLFAFAQKKISNELDQRMKFWQSSDWMLELDEKDTVPTHSSVQSLSSATRSHCISTECHTPGIGAPMEHPLPSLSSESVGRLRLKALSKLQLNSSPQLCS